MKLVLYLRIDKFGQTSYLAQILHVFIWRIWRHDHKYFCHREILSKENKKNMRLAFFYRLLLLVGCVIVSIDIQV